MNKGILAGLLLLLTVFISGCARQGSPSGGSKDETPPSLEKAIPENETVNFDQEQVLLVFDEFIQLKNPSSGILISPPLQDVEYKVKRNHLTIDLPDSLQENTTYKINFGETIRDLNEGNILQNFSFVFATGPHLDSLSVKGKIVNAFSRKPAENILVGLYKQLDDSTLFKSNPSYFALSTEEGNYEITNIREDSFFIAAFQDENKNFRYDPPYESLAFQNEPFYLDSNLTLPDLHISKEVTTFPKLTCTPLGPRTLLLTTDRNKLSSEELTLSPEPAHTTNISVDSTIFFFSDDTEVKFTFLNYKQDTFQYTCQIDSSQPFTVFNKTRKQNEVEIQLNGLIDSVLSNPYYINDSVNVSLNIDSINNNSLFLRADTSGVKIQFIDSSVVSKNGFFLSSFNYVISPSNVENRGELSLVINDSNLINKHKILYLLTNKKSKKRYLEGGEQKVTFSNLQPGNYTVRIAIDENRNQSWDPVLFSKRMQPETIIDFPDQIEIKANWEQTVELKLSN